MHKSLAVFLLAGAVWAQRPASPPPAARELFDRHMREAGDAAGAAKAAPQIIRGRFQFVEAGISGTTTIYADGEGRSYQVLEAKGIGKIESGNDGDIEWERTTVTGPRVVRVGHTKGSLLRPPPTDTTHWLQDFAEARTAGEDTVDGKPCWQVDVRQTRTGPPTRLCFHKDSGLLASVSAPASAGSGTFQIAVKLTDYRPFAGSKVPHRIESGFGSNTMRIEIEEIRIGATMPEDVFEVPEEIQELARRQITEVEIKEREEDPNRPRLKRKRK